MAEGQGEGGRERTPVYQRREDPGFPGFESIDSSASMRSLMPRPVIKGKHTFSCMKAAKSSVEYMEVPSAASNEVLSSDVKWCRYNESPPPPFCMQCRSTVATQGKGTNLRAVQLCSCVFPGSLSRARELETS